MLAARTAYLQLVKHEHYLSKKEQQFTARIPQRIPRHNILDARGRTLAVSLKVPSLYLHPGELEISPGQAKEKISRFTGIPQKNLPEINPDKSFVWIKRELPSNWYRKLKKLPVRGLHVLDEYRRFYPCGNYMGCTVGFTGIDDNGLAGIEKVYENTLKPAIFNRFSGKDAKGNILVSSTDIQQPKGLDSSLVLNLDSAIQLFVTHELKRVYEEFKARSVSAVVMNCRNGQILALSTIPSYDNNRYSDYSSRDMRMRPVCDVYEPGSTFKSFVMAACLEEDLVCESDKIFCENGAWRKDGRTLHDCHRYGSLTAEAVIYKSSNIGAAKLGIKLGKQRLYGYIRAFGFGRKTGVDFPGEENGILRHPSKWSRISITSLPMGQEIGVTMLQIASAYSCIANGGRLIRPSLAKGIYSPAYNMKQFKPEVVRRVISEKTARRTLDILEKTVRLGTGRRAISMQYNIAGKTGTAQKAGPGGYSKDKYVASFVGIAPVEDPVITVIVAADEPKTAHYGGVVAAPAVRQIIEQTLNYLGVPCRRKICQNN